MTSNRRNFLKTAAFGCACCMTAIRSVFAETGHKVPAGAKNVAHGTAHWSYEGNSGPVHWGDLQPDFKMCQLGLEQTPIDLAENMKGQSAAPQFLYRTLPLRIVNNGHTIQVNAEPGSSCMIAGTKYDLLQFHFHHPSEHLVAGKSFDLECHFVHRSAAGELAVVGVFIRPGARNSALASVFDAMPDKVGPEKTALGAVDPMALFPKSGGYFRYMGSLTTPPCSEGLTWTVFKEPIEASGEQIQQFAGLFKNNARPVQRRNRRFVVDSN